MLGLSPASRNLSAFLLASSGAVASAALAGARDLVTLLSALTVLAVAGVGIDVLRRVTRGSPIIHSFAVAVVEISIASVLVFLWSGITLLLLYTVAGLKWQHGWQYAAVFSLFAAAHASVVWRLRSSEEARRVPLARAAYRDIKIEAIAIFFALSWLVSSGKLSTPKGDWAANAIFLSGGVSVLVLAGCLLVLRQRVGD